MDYFELVNTRGQERVTSRTRPCGRNPLQANMVHDCAPKSRDVQLLMKTAQQRGALYGVARDRAAARLMNPDVLPYHRLASLFP